MKRCRGKEREERWEEEPALPCLQVVGILGTDCVSRSQENLVTKARALQEDGITCLHWCGGRRLTLGVWTFALTSGSSSAARRKGRWLLAALAARCRRPWSQKSLRPPPFDGQLPGGQGRAVQGCPPAGPPSLPLPAAACRCGSYRLPPATITGSVQRELCLIEGCIGVGELAVSDHRGSVPTPHQLAQLASEARVGGMLSGKAGLLHCHMGPGSARLAPLREALACSRGDIPITQASCSWACRRGACRSRRPVADGAVLTANVIQCGQNPCISLPALALAATRRGAYCTHCIQTHPTPPLSSCPPTWTAPRSLRRRASSGCWMAGGWTSPAGEAGRRRGRGRRQQGVAAGQPWPCMAGLGTACILERTPRMACARCGTLTQRRICLVAPPPVQLSSLPGGAGRLLSKGAATRALQRVHRRVWLLAQV